MRKLLIYLVILVLCGPALAPQEPMLGELPDASQFPMPIYLGLFNEGAGGIVNDLSGNKSTGTLVGDTHWVGSALSFDGTSDYITLGKRVLDYTKPFTIIARIKSDTVSGSHHIVTTAAPAQLYRGAAYLYFTASVGKSNVFVAGEWIQVAVTFDGTDMTLYADGRWLVTTTHSIAQPTGTTNIGAYGAGLQSWDGLIDYVAMYQYCLAAQQIAQLYQNPWPWFVEDPIELWAIEEAPTGSQVIFINFSSVGYGFGGFGLILLLAIIKKLRNRK